MTQKRCPIPLWLVILAVLSIIIVVVSQMGTVGAIIGTIIGVCTIIYTAWRKIPRWWLLRDPLKLTYLIPQYQYPEKQFVGALPWEQKPTSLTIGIGHYYILMLVTPNITLTASNYEYIQLQGRPSKNKPRMIMPERSPFIVEVITDSQGITKYKDWWGNISTAKLHELGQYKPDTVAFIVRQIETVGDWQGEIIATFFVKEKDRPIEKKLQLKVSSKAEADQIPFLHIQ